MGYILPIQMDTRTNYHQRMIAEDEEPFYVEKSYKVNHLINNKTSNDEQRKEKYTPLLVERRKKMKQLYDERSMVIETSITGKGKQVNERI
ncbi:MAG TPA: hypothetical protein VK125_00210 [Bacillota bacterium]|nr:hypothetical protein [Bacillota bacterium]